MPKDLSTSTRRSFACSLQRTHHSLVSRYHRACIATTASNHNETAPATPRKQQSGVSARKLIDEILPRSKFGRSIFTTPLLLILRLFYQATSFEYSQDPPQRYTARNSIWKLYRKASTALTPDHAIEGTLGVGDNDVANYAPKIPTNAWPLLLQTVSCPVSPTSTVRSMTWVKSLSAPLSHEYLQFVVECSESGKCFRMIAERDTDGDWAYLIASSTPNETIMQLRPYDYQHDLPLPLLSVSWSHLSPSEWPTMSYLASVIAQTSQLYPEYNVMREHCWWYAELVFEQMYASTPNASSDPITKPTNPGQSYLRHWPSALYRYSYIVLDSRWLKRSILVDRAKAFKEAMDEDGQLRW